MKIRYHEGIYYSGDKKILDSLIIDRGERKERPRALIVPHSDLAHASRLLNEAFSFIKGKGYTHFIVISPIHSGRRKEDESSSFFEGEENKEEGVITLGAEKREYYAEEESSAEILLPYFNRYAPGCSISIIYTDIKKAKESKELSSFLEKYKNKDTLFIISTNLTSICDRMEERKEYGDEALKALREGGNILDLTNKNKVHICAGGAVDSVNRIIKGEWRLVEAEDYGSVIHALLWK